MRPTDPQHTFERVCGDFWYYWLRSWTKLLRGDLWAARYDYNFVLLGNLVGLLRLEANALDRWRATSAATAVEHLLSAALASAYAWLWPQQLAERVLAITTSR